MASASDTPDLDARAAWFAETLWTSQRREVGEQAGALLAELETVFVAGAWIATVILAAAIVDAHVRAGGGAHDHAPTGVVWHEAGLDEDFHWLRQHRNRLLHFGREPYLTVDMFWFQADELEADARRAVELVAEALAMPTPNATEQE